MSNLCKNEISEKEIEILKRIYINLYKTFKDSYIDVFLCGGKSDDIKTFRKKLNDKFKNSNNNINIFYPENIFNEYYHLNKKNTNYLDLENKLGEQVDFICIICESWGSVTELGAFVNHQELCKKVIAINEKIHEDSESFINVGPIKYLNSNHDNSYISYQSSNPEDTYNELLSIFKKRKKDNLQFRDIDKITGMYHFVLLLLYFFKKLDIIKISKMVEHIINEMNFKNINVDILLNASKKLLFEKEYIVRYDAEILITKRGEKFMQTILSKNSSSLYNQIICDIIKLRY